MISIAFSSLKVPQKCVGVAVSCKISDSPLTVMCLLFVRAASKFTLNVLYAQTLSVQYTVHR